MIQRQIKTQIILDVVDVYVGGGKEGNLHLSNQFWANSLSKSLQQERDI